MAERLTIYAGPPVTTVLDGYGGDGDAVSRTSRINTICERYQMVCNAAPALSRAEWLALCDVLRSTLLDPISIQFMHHDVRDSDAADIARWGADRETLAERIAALSIGEKIAVAEVVAKWWRAEGDHDARLAAAGVAAPQA